VAFQPIGQDRNVYAVQRSLRGLRRADVRWGPQFCSTAPVQDPPSPPPSDFDLGRLTASCLNVLFLMFGVVPHSQKNLKRYGRMDRLASVEDPSLRWLHPRLCDLYVGKAAILVLEMTPATPLRLVF
jgi:hypothetical protein